MADWPLRHVERRSPPFAAHVSHASSATSHIMRGGQLCEGSNLWRPQLDR